MFLTISYISNVSHKLSKEEIEIILSDAKTNNNNNGISGILIYADTTFFHTLEGEHDKIVALFKKIEDDDRHYNVLKLMETKSSKRRYNRFTSKYIVGNTQKASSEFIKFLEINIDNMADRKLHDLIISRSNMLLEY